MNSIDKLCEAIMKYEGLHPGSVAYRNSNPGNLRASPMAAGKDSRGYCIFNTFAEGWNALVWDISRKCQGFTRTGLGPTSTVAELFKVYAPAEDSNDPDSYCQYVCNRAGFEPDTTLGEIYADSL